LNKPLHHELVVTAVVLLMSDADNGDIVDGADDDSRLMDGSDIVVARQC
jgi:hypothetical protein